MTNSGAFEKFDALVRKVFSVSHDEIAKREKEYQRKRKRAKRARAKPDFARIKTRQRERNCE